MNGSAAEMGGVDTAAMKTSRPDAATSATTSERVIGD
jgi:hypothetical protein